MSDSDRLLATKHMVDLVSRQAALVPIEAVEALVQEINREETLMPLLDPTAYMRIADRIPEHKRVAEAFLRFRRELETLRPKVTK